MAIKTSEDSFSPSPQAKGSKSTSFLKSTLFLRHDSRNKVKHSRKILVPLLGIDPGSPWYKTNALTTEPKSQLSDAVVRD